MLLIFEDIFLTIPDTCPPPLFTESVEAPGWVELVLGGGGGGAVFVVLLLPPVSFIDGDDTSF